MAALDEQLITMLYGAIDSDLRWVELMNLLRRRFGVESVAAQYLVARHQELVPLWCSRDTVSQGHASLHDSWANSLANPRFRRPLGPSRELDIDSDTRCEDYSPQDRRDLRHGLAQCGLGPAFWLSQQIDADSHFTLIFHRAAGDGRDMTTDDRALLNGIAPHFRQVVRLWERLAAAEARTRLVEQAGDRMMSAVLACDTRLRVHWMNSDARQVLACSDVLALCRGSLTCTSRSDHDKLRALVEGRIDRAVISLGGDGRSLLHVRIQAPAQDVGQFARGSELVLLAITRPDHVVSYDPQDIALLFGLTTTEAALAASLATGTSVSEFAAERGVAEGTARTHLKRVLGKTGSARQSDLVRRICLSVAGRPT